MKIEDNWSDDDIQETQGVEVRHNVFDQPAELPKFLTDLRDGLVGPAPEKGMARAKRIEQMGKDVVALSEFVNDLDRYAEHAKSAELVGNVVGPEMHKYLTRLRAKAVASGKQIYREMTYLKEHS